MKSMTDLSARPGNMRKRKKRFIPLSNLMASDAVKTVSDSPHRLEELLLLLQDRDRCLRGRAAATLAQLATLHPLRLMPSVPRLRDGLADESAYVRWNLVYTLGMLCTQFLSRLQGVLPDIVRCLDDQNRIVRFFASKVLAQIAVHSPQTVEELFLKIEKEAPPVVAHILRNSGSTLPDVKRHH
jgi:HEAT repeat protein